MHESPTPARERAVARGPAGPTGAVPAFEGAQRDRLERTLVLILALALAYALVALVIRIPRTDAFLGADVAAAVGVAVSVAVGLALVREGRPEAAVLVSVVLLVIAPPLAVLLNPAGADVELVVPLLALALAVSFTKGRTLRFVALAAWASATLMVGLIELPRALEGALTGGQFTGKLVGGSLLFAVVTALLLEFNARIRHLMGRVRVTQDALEQANAELERANAFKAQFMANAAHELRTPLTPMRVQLHLLKRAREDERPVRILERSFTRLERLVDEIVDASRLSTGTQGIRLEWRRFDASRFLEDVLATWRAAADARGVTLTGDVEDAVTITADRERLGQVLDNLLSNALKFTPTGGRIRVLLRRTPQGGIALSVTDSGPGVPPHAWDAVFRPFEQVRDPARPHPEGVGLGLFIARGLVTAHGGTLAVTPSAPGDGATFTLTLPPRSADAAVPVPDAATPGAGTG